MSSDHIASLQDWIGRTKVVEDIVTPRLVASFRAMLPSHLAQFDEAALPLGVHWCLAPDIADTHELGRDGHPRKGGFLPPVPLPRRMWAAGEVRFREPHAFDGWVQRRSTIKAIEQKQGRTGPLVFVTVRHQLSNKIGPLLEEDHIIVYREDSAQSPAPETPPPAPIPAPHESEIAIDPVLLFRYSALTFNGHRIHYDFPYATEVEHYSGLVIHGPLQATLLMNFAAIVDGRLPRRFSFRGLHPATGAQKLLLRATPDQAGGLALEVRAAGGQLTMKAEAQW